MTTKLISPKGNVKFADRDFTSGKDTKGKFSVVREPHYSTQGSDEEDNDRDVSFFNEGTTGSKSKARRGIYEGTQGEFSGDFDEEGHPLKSNGTPDMRFKENFEYRGMGYAGTTQGGARGYASQQVTPNKGILKRRSPSKSARKATPSRVRGKNSVLFKSDGTPDMRYKSNRDEFVGEGFENTTSRSTSVSKASLGIYEGNTPGEHSGKFDREGHHLKSDGTPDMRFKENREEFGGEGFEGTLTNEDGTRSKRAKYTMDETDFDNKKTYYRRKRPPTPYALYVKEKAVEMKREDPDMGMNDVFRELGRIWSNELTDKEKDKYYEDYEKEVQRYQEMNKIPKNTYSMLRRYSMNDGGRFNSKKGRLHYVNRNTENEDYDDEDEQNVNPNDQ